MKEIRFRDLSTPLQAGIIGGIIYVGVFFGTLIISFLNILG